MWIELPPLWIALLNCLGIPVVHLSVSWIATRMPAKMFEARGAGSGIQDWEKPIYERWLLVRRWKDLLPDAGPWFGGVAKKRLAGSDPDYLRSFAAENRRGEWAHWVQMLVLMLFVVWTPAPWWPVIVVYAVLSNLPCIVSQRHTRLRVARVLSQSARD